MAQTLVRCPACETGYFPPDAVDPTTGMVKCECGHRAAAAFLSEAAYLQARLDWVRDRIRAGDSATTSGPAPAVAPTPAPASTQLSAQSILLGVGALLLVVAAAVFTAVAWPRLGATGQIALIVGATGLAAVLAVRLRHRLRGTAEALAALTVGLAVVVLVALPLLGVVPERWQQAESAYWLAGFFGLAVAAVVGGRATGLRAWSWLGWANALAAAAAATTLAAGPPPVDDRRLTLAFAVLAVAGVVLVAASWVVPALEVDRWPMQIAGSLALLASLAVVAGSALGGLAVAEAAATTAVAAAVLGVMTRMAGPDARHVFAWGTGLLAVVSAGLLLSLLPATAIVGVVVAVLGAAMLQVGVRAESTALAVAATAVLWATWLGTGATAATPAATSPPDDVTWFMVSAAVALFAAAWVGRGRVGATWLAWPGAVLGSIAFVLLVPDSYPTALEAWTLPVAGLLALAGWVAGRGRAASSVERLGPALAVALLPSAAATWVSPWVLALDDAGPEHAVRLAVVLAVGGALMVLAVRGHWLGVLLPSSAAVVIAALAQVWTGLDALPRWVALGIVGILLVLAGARFEWLRSEGRRARLWIHQTA